jgi:hypothetical protein
MKFELLGSHRSNCHGPQCGPLLATRVGFAPPRGRGGCLRLPKEIGLVSAVAIRQGNVKGLTNNTCQYSKSGFNTIPEKTRKEMVHQKRQVRGMENMPKFLPLAAWHS